MKTSVLKGLAPNWKPCLKAAASPFARQKTTTTQFMNFFTSFKEWRPVKEEACVIWLTVSAVCSTVKNVVMCRHLCMLCRVNFTWGTLFEIEACWRKTSDAVLQADSAKVDLLIDNLCPVAPNQLLGRQIHPLSYIYPTTRQHTRMSLRWNDSGGDCSFLQPLLMNAIIITQQNQYSQFLLGRRVGVALFEVGQEWAVGLCSAQPQNKIYGKAVFIADWF